MSGKRNALSALAAVTVVSVTALLYAGISGPSSRNWPASTVITEAATAEELYGIWAYSGSRGLRVVNMGSFLNYREPEGFQKYPVDLPGGEVPYLDTQALIESSVDHTSYLWAAYESGIVRRIDHILPVEDFVRKAEYASTVAGVTVRKNSIELSDYGTPRIITTRLTGVDEPVILNIDASYFDKASMQDFLSVIEGDSLKPAVITLYFAQDSPDVTDKGRDTLRSALPLIRSRYAGKGE